MSIDYEIFEGKSLSSLFEDIYKNTEYNRKQLDILTKELVQFIKDGDTAVQIVPMIKEYLEINVKNTIKDIQTESDKIHSKIENADRIN